MKTRIETQIAWFRRGVTKFENRLNGLFEEGWSLQLISIEKRGFRIVCYAVLTNANA